MWPLKGAVVLTERPAALHRDDEGRLHNDVGPAVGYRDGWGVWAIHGVRLTQQIVETPSTLTVEEIRGEQNVEVRRVMLERFGYDRYIRESGARLVHEDEWGKLWRTSIPDDEDLVVVEVVNSSPEPDGGYRNYMLRVDPELRPLLRDGSSGAVQKPTARNAVASTFGHRGEEYELAVQT